MLRLCREVNDWMGNYDQPWGIAGGWAIDLFVEKKTRNHSDIEIAILRENQHVMKNALADWSFQKAVSGELVEWGSETLELPIHELHGKHQKSEDCLEVLLNEVENDLWIFRRDSTITFPSSTLFLKSDDGIPYLHPAIVLLYKAKNVREKDHADLEVAKDLLSREDQQWLCAALETHMPGHEWISRLQGVVE